MESKTATEHALTSLLWSLAQNWGSRALTFGLFLILARLISPQDFGLASAVALVILLISVVAEFGFGEAIIQKRDLTPVQINLPFFFSIILAVILAGVAVALSGVIERAVNLPGLGKLIAIACFTAPLVTISAFQEASYKRALDFRTLAIRLLVATAVSGVAGVSCALAGWGAASLVVQSIVLVAVGAAWLWSRPKWLPSLNIDVPSFYKLAHYGGLVVSNRLLDFVITRTVDVLILTLHGAYGLGLYTVGARVSQTAMQLFTSALNDVSLSAVSRIAQDLVSTRRAYLRSIAVAAVVASPCFMCAAALAPELSRFLFGAKWAGSEEIMRPLLLLGSVQCVQFMNGPYFGALGHPGYVLLLSWFKAVAVAAALLMAGHSSIGEMTRSFTLAQMIVTPLTFGLLAKLLQLKLRDIVKALAGPAIACGFGYIAIAVARWLLASTMMPDSIRIVLLAAAFATAYLLCIGVVARETLGWMLVMVRKRAFKFAKLV